MVLNWNEISKWAKSNGFKMSKKDGKITWTNVDNPQISGSAENVSEVATAIFNVITNNKWAEYQKEYKNQR